MAHLERASLREANLEGADLNSASFDKTSRLNGALLDGASFDRVSFDRVSFDRVSFDNTNLAVVEWSSVNRFGDEAAARQARSKAHWSAEEYRTAARAYQSMAVALRSQGVSWDATRFHYRSELMDRNALFYGARARLLSRRVLTAPRAYVRWLVSWAIGTFAGYGDYIGRLFPTYAVVVLGFALGMVVSSARRAGTQRDLVPRALGAATRPAFDGCAGYPGWR
jgi:hypothetical protein